MEGRFLPRLKAWVSSPVLYEQVGGKLYHRGYQIQEWLDRHPEVTKYVVVDDMDLCINECGHPFVQTEGYLGLTEKDGDRIIEMFKTS